LRASLAARPGPGACHCNEKPGEIRKCSALCSSTTVDAVSFYDTPRSSGPVTVMARLPPAARAAPALTVTSGNVYICKICRISNGFAYFLTYLLLFCILFCIFYVIFCILFAYFKFLLRLYSDSDSESAYYFAYLFSDCIFCILLCSFTTTLHFPSGQISLATQASLSSAQEPEPLLLSRLLHGTSLFN
jgi:hypothetical protein